MQKNCFPGLIRKSITFCTCWEKTYFKKLFKIYTSFFSVKIFEYLKTSKYKIFLSIKNKKSSSENKNHQNLVWGRKNNCFSKKIKFLCLQICRENFWSLFTKGRNFWLLNCHLHCCLLWSLLNLLFYCFCKQCAKNIVMTVIDEITTKKIKARLYWVDDNFNKTRIRCLYYKKTIFVYFA